MGKMCTLVGGGIGLVAAALWFWAAKEQAGSEVGTFAESAAKGVPYARIKAARAIQLNSSAAALTGISVVMSSIGSLIG